ncbi:jg15750 [Pararge aegeria aegeria]|uniref:Jg15750 protein n=1 Tax=Pararge aegeria aegeria TaxID=348720 RepID=A0A8S4RIN3_9NEOP|nr:jg15750 [Pararge aegeria aegeria]
MDQWRHSVLDNGYSLRRAPAPGALVALALHQLHISPSRAAAPPGTPQLRRAALRNPLCCEHVGLPLPCSTSPLTEYRSEGSRRHRAVKHRICN